MRHLTRSGLAALAVLLGFSSLGIAQETVTKYVVMGSTTQNPQVRELSLYYDTEKEAQNRLDEMQFDFSDQGLLRTDPNKPIGMNVVRIRTQAGTVIERTALPPRNPPSDTLSGPKSPLPKAPLKTVQPKWVDVLPYNPPTTAGSKQPGVTNPSVNPGLAAKPGLAVTITWNTRSDVDLWITVPGGVQCSYKNPRTTNGGILHEDNTTGFGPEHYTIPNVGKGEFVVSVHHFRSAGPTTVQIEVTRFAGTVNQNVQRYTVRLNGQGDFVEVCRIRY